MEGDVSVTHAFSCLFLTRHSQKYTPCFPTVRER